MTDDKKEDAPPQDYFVHTGAEIVGIERADISERRKLRNAARHYDAIDSGAEDQLRPHLSSIVAQSREPVSDELRHLIETLGEGTDQIKIPIGELRPQSLKESDTSPDDVTAEIDPDLLRQYDKGTDGKMGLALSGGGIRSSSFCLGVIQAMQRYSLFSHMDYLSTVSGGGYIGASFTALVGNCRTGSSGKEVWKLFEHKGGEVEPKVFRHLRNHAAYMTLGGLKDYLRAGAAVLRGAIINLVIVGAAILALAWLAAAFLGLNQISGIYANRFMPLTIVTSVLFLIGVLWTLYQDYKRSLQYRRSGGSGDSQKHKIKGSNGRLLGTVLGIFLFALIFDVFAHVAFYVKTVLFSPEYASQAPYGLIGGLLPLLASPFSTILARGAKKNWSRYSMLVFGIVIVVVLFLILAGLTGYFIAHPDSPNAAPNAMGLTIGPNLIALMSALVVLILGFAFIDINQTSLHAFYRDRLNHAFVFGAKFIDVPKKSEEEPSDEAEPKKAKQEKTADYEVELRPNIHVKLSSLRCEDKGTLNGGSMPTDGSKQKPGDRALSPGPYPLINAALNADDLREAYMKGRRADFFLFSPHYIGSEMTGYIETTKMEAQTPHLDLGTAVAISGAAAAPNAGNRINPLIGVLMAILNARLNYWIPNPHAWGNKKFSRRLSAPFGRPTIIHLFREMFGLNRTGNVTSDAGQPPPSLVNVSDGGHIENMGLYQLLKRECRFVIVVDAECDPGLKFGGFLEALRIAQIDLGIRIDMEGLDEIRSGEQSHAVGTIWYGKKKDATENSGKPEGENEKAEEVLGKLLYLKASMIGDTALEDVLGTGAFLSSPRRDDSRMYDAYGYISAYSSTHPDFPHQTTADQFFNEEQFEAYRALGYEIAMSVFRKDF